MIDANGLDSVLGVGDPNKAGSADRLKMRCSIQIDNLEPPMLREDVQRHVKYENREARRNDFVLFKILKDKARAEYKYHALSRGYYSKKQGYHEMKSYGLGLSHRKDRIKPPRSIERAKPAMITTSNDCQVARPREEAPPRTGCWHCKGPHWLRSCPIASEGDKTQASAAMQRINENRSHAKKARITPGAEEVLINGLVTVTCRADSGSRDTFVSRECLKELFDLGSCPSVTKLNVAKDVLVAGGSSVSCQDTVLLDIMIKTSAGPVNLHEVECIVMEGDEDDCILGNDGLVSLGIDVNHQLAQRAVETLIMDVNLVDKDSAAEVENCDLIKGRDLMVQVAKDSGVD